MYVRFFSGSVKFIVCRTILCFVVYAGKEGDKSGNFLFEMCLSMFQVGGVVDLRSSGEDNFANAVGET